MRGKPVWTFGRPFYAGWGLTHDTLDFPRRSRRVTLDELVAAALIAYPYYVDPGSGLPCEVEDLINALATVHTGVARPSPRGLRFVRALAEIFGRGPRALY